MVVHPEILDGVDLMARGAIASRLLLPHIVQVVADYTRDGELPVFSGFRAV